MKFKKRLHKILFGQDNCNPEKVITVQLPAPPALPPEIIYSVRENITEEEKTAIYKDRGRILEEGRQHRESRTKTCDHLKGGYGHNLDKGHADVYSVIKHVFPWRDMWVICTRCGKKWKPGDSDYEVATQFKTDNTTSTSISFMNVDIAAARELTKES